MTDVWRVTVGDKVQESESFTPLESILKKLVAKKQPFKVGFGQSSTVEVAGGAKSDITDDEEF